MSSNVLTALTLPLMRVKLKSNNFDSAYNTNQRWIKFMISLIRNKFDSTVNQMQPLSPVIRIKGNQRQPLTVFDHTFDVRKGVFSCSERQNPVPWKLLGSHKSGQRNPTRLKGKSRSNSPLLPSREPWTW